MKIVLITIIGLLLSGCATIESGCTPMHRNYEVIKRVAPNYPYEAHSKDIQGWTVVSLTIDKNGEPADIRVIDAEPKNIFDKASIEAASEMKFLPRIIGCKAIDVNDVQYKFNFSLDGNA